jgi:hypothetical protein
MKENNCLCLHNQINLLPDNSNSNKCSRYETIINNLRFENKKLKDNIITLKPEYNNTSADKKKDVMKGITCLFRLFFEKIRK